MIQRILDATDCDVRWVVQPTRSMTWGEAKILIAAVTTVSIAIGAWFYAHGYPLVLPFSGLEALAVAIAFYIVLREGENREVISLFPERVVIEKGRSRPDTREEFERAWARVELSHSPRRWYPSRLSISSHGRFIEVGKFLTNGEREALAAELINAIEKNR